MAVLHVALPADPAYPTPGKHAAAAEAALTLFKTELVSTDGYVDSGEKEGVTLSTKADPIKGTPLLKGEYLVKDTTSEAYLATIVLPNMRKRWDPRFESGQSLVRYSAESYSFYSVIKGVGFLISSRDIVGVSTIYRSAELNQEIVMVQTSVEEPELAPPQSGKTRATLHVFGYQLLPQGSDLKVTVIVQISLNGSIPTAVAAKAVAETPLVIARAAEVLHKFGHAPAALVRATADPPHVIIQQESFSDPSDKKLEYQCLFTSREGATVQVLYDTKTMYPRGVQIATEGEGVEATDDGKGIVSVSAAKGGVVGTLKISPKA